MVADIVERETRIMRYAERDAGARGFGVGGESFLRYLSHCPFAMKVSRKGK